MRRAIAWAPSVGLVLGLAVGVAIGACVKPSPRMTTEKNEIMALWTQIRDWRLSAGLAVDPAASDLPGVAPMSVPNVRAVCSAQPVSTQCDDVCDLADAICDNAERICDLADELHGDSWAEDKCTSAKASCRDAKKRCCACDDRASRAHLRGDDEDREN